ncbi:hypothetical protein F2Q70_00031377 [Brassica cretica]|uniref:Uncharacterized protein n=1 Tax=Brassica cretica TaxID=69181 RepID=A0A8S9FJ22_BRACR|nr:hypothetical protein F2Q70_00031377 [Brassica cretica]KAF3486847.1 hypothetical protein F2Q69_00055355 [Brassica cretica]
MRPEAVTFALLLMTYKYVSNPLLGLIFSFNSLKGSPVKRGGEGRHAPPVRQGDSHPSHQERVHR